MSTSQRLSPPAHGEPLHPGQGLGGVVTELPQGTDADHAGHDSHAGHLQAASDPLHMCIQPLPPNLCKQYHPTKLLPPFATFYHHNPQHHHGCGPRQSPGRHQGCHGCPTQQTPLRGAFISSEVLVGLLSGNFDYFLAFAVHLGLSLPVGHDPSPGQVRIALVIQHEVENNTIPTPEDEAVALTTLLKEWLGRF